MSTSHESTQDGPRPWRRTLVLATATVVVLLVALGVWSVLRSDDEPGEDVVAGDATSEAGLDGAYVLLSGSIDGEPVPIVAGSEPTLTIDGDQWGGRAACNSYGTQVEVSTDGAVTIGEGGITEMGCEPALMESEAAYVEGFWRVDSLVVDGVPDLVLLGDGVDFVYRREAPPVEGGPFIGIDWQLDTIVEGETARHSPPPWGSLRFGSDESLFATGPCVMLTGTYVFDGIELQSTTMSAEYAASCGGEPGPDDAAIISTIESSRPVVTDGGGKLTLSHGDDQLVYLRADQTDEALPPPADGDEEAHLAAVTSDLRLVEVAPDGSEGRPAIDLRDAIPGISGVDTVAVDDAREVVYLGVRRGNGDDSLCDGAVMQVDYSGGATAVADGITPALSPDGSRLAFGTIEDIDGMCLVSGVGVIELTTGERTDIDIADVDDSGAPDWNLSWWPDGTRIVVSFAGNVVVHEAAPSEIG